MLSKGNGRDTGEQLVVVIPEPRSNPASARGPATDEVLRPLAREAREGGPAPNRRPDGGNSQADKPDGEQQASGPSIDSLHHRYVPDRGLFEMDIRGIKVL
jgi:hypothetical protein